MIKHLFADSQRLLAIRGISGQNIGTSNQLALGIRRDHAFVAIKKALARTLSPIPQAKIMGQYHLVFAIAAVENRSLHTSAASRKRSHRRPSMARSV